MKTIKKLKLIQNIIIALILPPWLLFTTTKILMLFGVPWIKYLDEYFGSVNVELFYEFFPYYFFPFTFIYFAIEIYFGWRTNIFIFSLPLIASIAAAPVSPEVATIILIFLLFFFK